jgi:N-hydroxyarylamine O-acetyltransferase
MNFTPDLARYFERIEHPGAAAPNLANLNALIFAHVSHIPFENLDVLLGRPIVLDPAAIEEKLITRRRGGYCFEQNTFFMYVLQALGYSVTPISARVRLGRTRDETPARTHCFLRVELPDGSWLVDVGVGGLSPCAALRLTLDAAQDTPHEPRRITSEGEWRGFDLRAPRARLFHQAFFDDAWHDVCDFTLEAMAEIDRELGNWFTSTHPSSHFKARLSVARATLDGRLTLLNRRFTRRQRGSVAEQRELVSPEELLRVLDREFGLAFPSGTRFDCSGLDW